VLYRIQNTGSLLWFGRGFGQGLIFTTQKLTLPAFIPPDQAGLSQSS